MYEKENEDIRARVRNSLLKEARRLTQIPESKLKGFIRRLRFSRRKWLGKIGYFERHCVVSESRMICIYRSELHRRRTGKHWFNMTLDIMQGCEVAEVVYLSDIVPHVVEEGAPSEPVTAFQYIAEKH